MRLTLRTLLAHLDNILDPQDAADIGQKIEQSEFAGQLAHRIRGCTRRIRLGAPALQTSEGGLDANTVAEYLDNTLPSGGVPDFEKVCLDSEVHLAEVASAHQILTLVLGESAEVDPSIRERAYRILDRAGEPTEAISDQAEDDAVPTPLSAAVASAVTAQAATGDAATGDATTGDATTTGVKTPGADAPVKTKKVRRKPEVPDYLREKSRVRLFPFVATVALAAALAIVVLRAMGPFDAAHPVLAGIFGDRFAVLNTPQETMPPPTEMSADTPQSTPQSGQAEPPPAAIFDEPIPLVAVEPPGEPTIAALDPGGPPTLLAEKGLPHGDSAPTTATDLPANSRFSATDVASTEVEPGFEPAAEPADPGVGPLTVPELAGAQEPPLPDGSSDPSLPAEGDVRLLARGDPGLLPDLPPGVGGLDSPAGHEPPDAAPPAAEGVPAPNGILGRYTSDDSVLCRWDAESLLWQRLSPREPLNVGDQLIVLPTYRPQILLSSNVQLTLDGGTRLELGSMGDGTPQVILHYGRALVVPVGRAGARLGLVAGGTEGMITFSDAESGLAVQLQPFHTPGTDPESNAAHRRLTLITTSGRIDWNQAEGERIGINAGSQYVSLDDRPGALTDGGQLPEWINSTTLSDIDKLASATLQPMLVQDRPISLTLSEIAEHRRIEVRSLAVRCLSYLDIFDNFVPALNDANQRSYWSAHFDAMQAALARSPATAVRVRQTLEKHRGGDAAELFHLLWGLSPDDLDQNSAARLVSYLDHEDLDFRVLGFENLQRITGLTLFYRPEHLAARRRSHVLRWKEKLDSNAIVYRVLPEAEETSAEAPESVDETTEPAEAAAEAVDESGP